LAKVDVRRRVAARAIVEQLTELREAELDETDQPLADLGLLGHKGHREPGRLAQLGPDERVAGGRRVAHGHLGEASGIGRVGLRPGEPALGKVLRRERVDHRHGDVPPAEVRRDRHPVMTRRLHRHEGHGLCLAVEPGIECSEAGPALAHPEDLPVGPSIPRPAERDRMTPSADVDPDRRHRAVSFRGPQGCPLAPVDVT
jgi:hypothetical protein